MVVQVAMSESVFLVWLCCRILRERTLAHQSYMNRGVRSKTESNSCGNALFVPDGVLLLFFFNPPELS